MAATTKLLTKRISKVGKRFRWHKNDMKLLKRKTDRETSITIRNIFSLAIQPSPIALSEATKKGSAKKHNPAHIRLKGLAKLHFFIDALKCYKLPGARNVYVAKIGNSFKRNGFNNFFSVNACRKGVITSCPFIFPTATFVFP